MPTPISRELLRLATPAIATGLLATTVFLVDRVMLARHSENALASMQFQGPLLWSISSVFMASCAGTVALVARNTGRNDFARARLVARAGLLIAGVVGLVVGASGYLGLEHLLRWIGPDQEPLRDVSRAYLRITFVALPFSFIAMAAAMILGGSGDTRTPLWAGLTANVTNIAVNSVLIFGIDTPLLSIPSQGVAGAATGTATAFVVEALVLIVVLRRPGHPLRISRLETHDMGFAHVRWRDELRVATDIVRLSWPAVTERGLQHIGFLAFALAITELGALSMAANQSLITLESLCFMCADGFGIAAATIVGQRLGRNDVEGAAHGCATATWLAVATITGMGLVLWGSGEYSLPLFVAPGADEGRLVDAARACLPVLALSQPWMTAAIVLSQALRGAGDTRSPLLAGSIGGLAVRVSLAWTLPVQAGLGLAGIWWASAIDWIIRTAILVPIFRRRGWSRIKL